jgi:hypothetical protein
MFTASFLLGAAMCIGSFFVIQPIARWWVRQHEPEPLRLRDVETLMRDDDKAYRATQATLHKTGETFGAIMAIVIFIGGIIVGNF